MFGLDELAESVATKPFLHTSPEEVRALWREVCAQVRYNYEDNAATEVPGFALFGYSAEGRPEARLTRSFLRGNNFSSSSDKHLAPSAQRQLCYSQLNAGGRAGAKSMLQFVLQALGDAVRVRAQRVCLPMPSLGEFTFDRATRRYTFRMARDLPERLPSCCTWGAEKVVGGQQTTDVYSDTAAAVRPASQEGHTSSAPGRSIRPTVQQPRPFEISQRGFAGSTVTGRRPFSSGSYNPAASHKRYPGETVPRPLTTTVGERDSPRDVTARLAPQEADPGLTVTGMPAKTYDCWIGGVAGRTQTLPFREEVPITSVVGKPLGASAGPEVASAVKSPKPLAATASAAPAALASPTAALSGSRPASGSAPRPASKSASKPASVAGSRPPSGDGLENRAEEFTRTFCKTFHAPIRAHTEFGPIFERTLKDEAEKAKQEYLAFRRTGLTPADLARSARLAKGELLCPPCYSKRELEARRRAAKLREEQERREYTEAAKRAAEAARLEEEKAARERYERQKAVDDANLAASQELERARRAWRASGHFNPEGALEEMPALLSNDDDAPRRRREAAERFKEDFLRDCEAKRAANAAEAARQREEERAQGRAAAEEEDLRKRMERAAELAKQRAQDEVLQAQIAEYNSPEFASQRIPASYDLGNTIPDDGSAARAARQAQEARAVRDAALADMQAKEAAARAEDAQRREQERQEWLADKARAADEAREAAEREKATREFLRTGYEEDIAARKAREQEEKDAANRPCSARWFRDNEDDETAPCDCCKHQTKVKDLILAEAA